MMHDLVSSALAARARDPEGLLRRMLVVSFGAHAALMVAAVLLPGLLGTRSNTPETVMTISLGGAPGPRSGGMTPISGRPVQRVEPTPELPRPQPVRPPAPKPPEMVEPAPRAKPTPKPPVRQAPDQAAGRTPTTGAREQAGQARADTGSQSTELGLSTAGGGTGGQINLGDFCCPEYIGEMIGLMQRNWNARQSVAGICIVRFTIARDGTISAVELRRSSGYQMLDFLAQRAVLQTAKLPPLPVAYTNPTLTINLSFEYIR